MDLIGKFGKVFRDCNQHRQTLLAKRGINIVKSVPKKATT
jgi:hypothetical protein